LNRTAQLLAFLASLLPACAPASHPAPARSPLLASLEGTWGVPGSDVSCSRNPETIQFSDDGAWMLLTFREPIAAPDGSQRRELRYRLRSIATDHVRLEMEGETRRTETGELVVWDLLQVAPEAHCWRRTDWKASACTPRRHRCGSDGDSRELMRTVVSEILGQLQRGEFDAIAASYFLPDSLSPEAAASERRRLAEELAALTRALGHPTGLGEYVQPAGEERRGMVEVSVTHGFWDLAAESSELYVQTFSTRFRRGGDGFFQIICVPSGHPLALSFAVPDARLQWIEEIGRIRLRGLAPGR